MEKSGKIDKEINQKKKNGIADRLWVQLPKNYHQKVVRPTILGSSESWRRNNKSKIVATKMRFLRRIKKMRRSDRMKNQTGISELNLEPIELVFDESNLVS
jgi:hypothetical protein